MKFIMLGNYIKKSYIAAISKFVSENDNEKVSRNQPKINSWNSTIVQAFTQLN